MWDLTGKVAIVTGTAPGGIGETYAQHLAGAGAAVVCADINTEGAEAVAASIRDTGGKAVATQVDIVSDESVAAMVGLAVSEFGGVDILVNNAALMAQLVMSTAMDYTRELWDLAFAVNVTGSWNCARAVAPLMAERGGGRIINQASAGAFPADSVYGITKLAVIGLTTTLARELGPLKIAVNCIAPGATASTAGTMLTPLGSPYRDFVEQNACLHGVGQREELCGALMLFAGQGSSWITGQVLNVDGGTIRRP